MIRYNKMLPLLTMNLLPLTLPTVSHCRCPHHSQDYLVIDGPADQVVCWAPVPSLAPHIDLIEVVHA
jgi:hypothetical protein